MLFTYILQKKNLNKSGGNFTETILPPPCPLPAPSITQTYSPSITQTYSPTHTHTHPPTHPPPPPHTQYSLSGCLPTFSTQEKYTK